MADSEIINLEAKIDLSQWSSAVNQMLGDAAKIQALSSSVDVKLNVDSSGLDAATRAISGLQGSVANVKIDALVGTELQNTADLINRIDSEKVSVGIDALVDTEFQNAANLISKLDEDVKVKVDATIGTELKNAQDLINRIDGEGVDIPIDATDNTADELTAIKEKLTNLQTLGTITLTLEAADFITGIDELAFFSTIADQETATATVIAQTTRDIVDKADIIEDTYTNAFGESRAEIAHFLVGMANVRDDTGNFIVSNEDLADSVTALFEAQNATMLDTEEIFQAATALVQNGLVPTYRDAYNFITQGARDGLNVNNDLLTSIDEYTLQFAEAGISAEGFYNVLRTSAETGQFQTDKAVDLIKESTNLAREEIEDFNQTGTLTPRIEQIQKLDLMDEGQAFAQGTITGEEWLSAVLVEIDKLPTEAEQRFAELQIFGPTQVEEVGSGFLEALDFAKDVDWTDAASNGATAINDTLSVTLEETARTFDSALSEVLNNVIGQPGGFLDQLKNAALAFADEIQSGGSLGSAIELALQLPEGQIARIESAIGNFALAILEVTANILDAVGVDSSGVRATLADTAKGQLAFDLQTTVNEGEVADAITRAANRGVEQADIENALTTAIDEQLASGDILGAQQLVDSVDAAFDSTNLSEFTQQALEAGQTVAEVIQMLEDAKADTSMAGPGSLIESQVGNIDAEIAKLQGGDIRLFDFQTQIDTAFAEAQVAYDAAVANLDLDTALDVGEQLEIDPAETGQHIQEQFRQAFAVAAESGDIEGADALWDKMLAIDPEFELAGDLQQILHKAEQTVTDSTTTMTTDIQGAEVVVATSYSNIETASGKAVSTVEDNTAGFGTSFNAISLGSMVLLLATGNYNALATAVQTSAPGMVAQLTQISDALAGFASSGGQALGVIGNLQSSQSTVSAGGSGVGISGPQAGGKGQIGHAEGGVKDGWGWVGEDGPELMHTDSRVAILNNKTSTSLVSGLNSMFGGGMGGGQTSNTYQINNTFNVPNLAVGLSAGNQIADAVRGF